MRHKASHFRSSITASGQIQLVCELTSTGHAAVLNACPQDWATVSKLLRRMELRGSIDLTHWTVEVPAQSLVGYVTDTRRYGQTYLHAPVRRSIPADGVLGSVEGRAVRITYRGWGKSLLSKTGHKYKVHANYTDSGKPVPSNLLNAIR